MVKQFFAIIHTVAKKKLKIEENSIGTGTGVMLPLNSIHNHDIHDKHYLHCGVKDHFIFFVFTVTWTKLNDDKNSEVF